MAMNTRPIKSCLRTDKKKERHVSFDEKSSRVYVYNTLKQEERRVELEHDDESNKILGLLHQKGFDKTESKLAKIDHGWFESTIRRAVGIWQDNCAFDKTITPEHFAAILFEYLSGECYLDERHYLKDLTIQHLEKFFNIYSVCYSVKNLSPATSIDLFYFCLLFTFIFRENLPGEESEITLAHTIDAIYPQLHFFEDKLFLQSRCSTNDWLKYTTKAYVTFEEGRKAKLNDHNISFGLLPILHVQNKRGAVLHFPLLYSAPIAIQENSTFFFKAKKSEPSKVGFTDLMGNVRPDLSHLPELILDLKALESGPLFDILSGPDFLKIISPAAFAPVLIKQKKFANASNFFPPVVGNPNARQTRNSSLSLI